MNFAAQARAKVRAKYPDATVHERRANGIVHRLPDAPDGKGRFAGDYFIGPIHYGEPDWQEIDTAFVPSTAPWDHEMTKADFHVRALSRLDAGQVVEYRDGDEWVRFQPMALQYSNDLDQIQPIAMPENVEAVVDDDTLLWPDGYGPGRSLSWQAQTARLAKLLTIGSAGDLPPVEQYIIDGGEPCLELNLIFAYSSGVTPYINGQPWNRKQIDTQGRVEFRNGAGKVVWWFALPMSYDVEGNGQLGTLRFKKVGNALYVSHRIPLSFVQNAAYPLMVDVDVDKQTAASGDDGSRYTGTDGFSATRTSDGIGYLDNVVMYHAHHFARWLGVSIEGTVDVSYEEIYVSYVGNTAELKVYGVDEDNPAAPTSAAEFDADPLTTAAVDWDGPWDDETWEQSPSLNAIFQELVDTYTISNDAVMLQNKNDHGTPANERIATRGFDYAGNLHGPKLHVEYTSGAPEGQPTMVRTQGIPTGPGARDRPGRWN